MPGKIRGRRSKGHLTLERKFLTKTTVLDLDDGKCFGCGLCMTVCPKEAITLSEATIEDGRLVEKPMVVIDVEKCVMCGICVTFCPSNALSETTNNEKDIPVQVSNVIPELRKAIRVDYSRCNIECGLTCQDACPVEAVNVKKGDDDASILEVTVDEDVCFYCGKCAEACPYDLIEVAHPFEGRIQVDASKCPEGCKVCVDACPTTAMSIVDSGPTVDESICILCSACERMCPEDALKINRTSVARSDEVSGAWFRVLEEITSQAVLARELGIEADKKRNSLLKERFSLS